MRVLDLDTIFFPPLHEAEEDGLLAIGGDLSTARLLEAYRKGIFPWFNPGEPILWWSPDPRFVLFPNRLKVSKSMRQLMRKTTMRVTMNQAFGSVIRACATVERPGQQGTWITTGMVEAYSRLHALGIAKSVEVWEEGVLVGGLYGIDLGNGIFSGESMFSKKSNASKLAFISLIQNSNYELIDCQVYTSHLESLGAEEISRKEFVGYLEK